MRIRKPLIKILLLIFLFSTISSSASLALYGRYDYSFFSSNDIGIYDPRTGLCPTATEVADEDELAPGIGDEQDYAGNPILNQTQISEITANQSIYEEAADEVGIPWQMLATLHLKGSSLLDSNPENGLGVYQLPKATPETYPAGAIDDGELLEQSIAAAEYLKDDTPELKDDIERLGPIKRAFYSYLVPDAADQAYKDQATNLDFSNGYDGSPEVMNKVDKKRDPAQAEENTWGQYNTDLDSLTYPTGSQYGAYAVFASIAGVSLSNCGGFASGGMNLDEAKEFIELYKEIDDGDPNDEYSKYVLPALTPYSKSSGSSCTSSSKTANCVAFSVYFVNKHTTLKPAAPNGSRVVKAMADINSDLSTGKVPRPYAIFSVPTGSTLCSGIPCGHTGVVLGVDEDRDKVIVGEAAWCNPGWTAAREYSLSAWTNTNYTYAYTEPFIKEDSFNSQ